MENNEGILDLLRIRGFDLMRYRRSGKSIRRFISRRSIYILGHIVSYAKPKIVVRVVDSIVGGEHRNIVPFAIILTVFAF